MKKTLLALLSIFILVGCDELANTQPKSDSGVSKAHVQVATGQDGLTIEQRNIARRVHEDNKPGAIKHLYVISPYSGQVIIYSTVQGKVTSSGKKLTPSTVSNVRSSADYGFPIDIAGVTCYTKEVLGDDGTYGSSSEYIYWTDVRGIYHQHYMTGGQILHISSEPLAVKSVTINMEQKAQ